MKKLILVLLVLTLSSYLAKAQRPNPLQYTAIKFSPLGLLDPVNGSLDVKVEYKTQLPISAQVSYGIGIPYSTQATGRIKDRYHKFRFELRSFFPSDYLQKRYLAIEGVFIPRRFEMENSFFRKGNTVFDFEQANVRSQTWALHLKLGSQKNWNGKLITDLFVGVGIRNLKTEYDANEVSIQSPGSVFFFDEFFFFGDVNRNDGISFFPSFTFGINIGFFAGKKRMKED